MPSDSAVQLATVDIVLLVVTTFAILGTALLATCLSQRKRATDAEAFFLSSRSMPWWAIGCSLFAANIGSEHYIAQAGTASLNGFPVALYEWLAAFLLLLLGYVFAPIYMRAAVITIPEFFEKRFNKWCRLALAIVCSVSYILTKIAATLYASAVFLEVILGWELYISVPIILFVTAFYTALGGLTAVIFTDVLQVGIALTGGFAALGVAMARIGGYQGIVDTFREVKLEKMLHIIREPSDPDYSWTGMFFGQMVASIWYWCLDQEMAQRVLSAKSLRHARSGVIMAGFLKILPPFVILFPGLAARAMYERCAVLKDPMFSKWCDADLRDPANSNRAYPLLVVKEFPVGVVGILVAAMLAAMTGALSAVFNSSATVLTFDIYQRFINPTASQRRLVLIGRLATAGMAVLSIGWLPVIKAQNGPLYLIVQDVITHFAPPLSSIFIVGVLFPSVNGTGALAGMFSGLLLGLVQYIWNLVMKEKCDAALGALGHTFYCLHFNHFAGIIFIVTCCVTFFVSWITGGVPKGPEREKIRGMTVWHGRDSWWMKPSKGEEDVQYASVETNAPSEEAEDGDERSGSFPSSPKNHRTAALASAEISMETLNAVEEEEGFPIPAMTFSVDDEKNALPTAVLIKKKSPTERVWERVNDALAATLVLVVCSLLVVWR